MYVIFSVQQMIDVANGKTAQGVTGTGGPYEGEAQALNYFTNVAGYTLAFVNGYGPMKEYYFTH